MQKEINSSVFSVAGQYWRQHRIFGRSGRHKLFAAKDAPNTPGQVNCGPHGADSAGKLAATGFL